MHIIEELLIDFQSMGYTVAGIERALGLKQGAFNIAKLTDSPEEVALLKMLSVFPWLIEVAEHNFDEHLSKRIMIHNAVDVLLNESRNREVKWGRKNKRKKQCL